MPIRLTLNPKNDQLVPINALKKWSEEHLNKVQDQNFLKQLFDKAADRPETFRDRAGELNNIIKKLPTPTEEKGGRVWFLKVFLEPFGQKITDEAKEIFEVLSKGWFGNKSSFAELEQAAEEYNGRLKTATTQAATSAMALNELLMNEMSPAVAEFANVYKQAKQAKQAEQAAQPAQTSAQAQPAQKITVEQILIGLQWLKDNKHDKLLTDFYGAIGAEGGEEIESVIPKMLKAAKDSQTGDQFFRQIYDQIFSKIMPFEEFKKLETVPDPDPEQKGPVQESLKSMKLTKRLYEAGLVDRSEYLAKLVEIKYILEDAPTMAPKRPTKEQIAAAISQARAAATGATTPAAATAGATAGAPAEAEAQVSQNTEEEDKVDKGIVTLIGTEGDPAAGEIAKLGSIATGIQDAMTRFAQGIITEALSFKQQQFAKLHTKKLVLSEYIETGKMPTKTQLNEFIISGLILAALAGALAWVASKFGAIFKGAYPTGTSHPSHSSGDKPDIRKTLPNITNGLAAGIDAKGNLVDIQGRNVPPVKNEIAELLKKIPTIQETINAGVNEISEPASYKVVNINQVQSQLAKVTEANGKLASAVAKLTADLRNLLQEAAKT
jgi:hypothetical protein